MKKNYKLYKIQPFRNDYKIVNISKKEYESLKAEYEKGVKK
tara:strand:- start:388 stop:510 length:123 start_codon:yes stop_codon:yes gene_type:complete